MSHRIYIETEAPHENRTLTDESSRPPSGGDWVEGQWIRGELWVHFRGETRKLESSAKSFGAGKAGRTKEDVSAPMPGKVTKLLCRVGQSVAAGDVLVVMEAMKMEYSLKSDVAGDVQKIECQAGDQVSLGKVLIRIKSAAEKI